jgi:hypothetical protein
MKKMILAILKIITGIIMLGNTIVYAKIPPPTPPVNDEYTGAIFITPTAGNSYTTYDNLNSTVSTGVTLPICSTPIGGDVWFAVIVPASGHLIFDAQIGTMTDGGMSIYKGASGNLNYITCNDNKSIGYQPNDSMPQIEKYGLNINDTIFIRFWGKGVTNFGTFQLTVIAAPLQSACSNLGFENGFNGWFATLGQQYNGATNAATPVYFPISFNNTNDPNFEIVTSGTDSYGGFPKVYSGTKSIKLGETLLMQMYDAATIEQTFTVGPTNNKFIYHYAVVLNDGTHPYYQQSFFKVELFDSNGNIDSCGLNTLILPDSSFIQSSIGSNLWYKPWTSVNLDLTAYTGQNVSIRFTISDCSPTGHFGYAYLDCECQAYNINSSRDTVCAGDLVTLTAPLGAYSYLWMHGGYTTNSIVVNPAVATTYYCTYTNSASDVCPGTIYKTIYIKQGLAIPAAAGNISSIGNNFVNHGQNHKLYVVPPINNAISYTWYYSGSGVTFHPSNKTTTDSVWLDFSATATSGNLTVVGHNNCSGDGLFSADYPIIVGPAAVKDNGKLNFSIYPNPIKDNLIVELNDKFIQNTIISIYNVQGMLLKQVAISQSKTVINMQEFTNGVYIVKLNNEKESFVSRIMKE